VKINDSFACTQELIDDGEVHILLINLGPLRCSMSTGMEPSGDCSHMRPTREVSDMIADTYLNTYLIFYVEMEFLQVGGPLLMAVILQFPLCLYEL
jgi:hypothetical protein